MKHFTIVGNWKMHQTPQQAVKLVKNLQGKLKPHTHVTTVVAPPFIDLVGAADVLEKDLVRLGAQNLSEKDEGAYTGEVSGPMLSGLVEYVIVGHSERRHYEHETDKRIAYKAAAAIRNDLKPILCVGENLKDRYDGHTHRVIVDQVQAGLSQISNDEINDVLIAYEPIWAIGTGEYAKPEEVKLIVSKIRKTVEELFGEAATAHVEVLYGGSVEPSNAKAYLKVEGVNGLLVGGASLNYEQFAAICATAGSVADGK